MDEAALLDCIDWVAHAFEVVYSVYPGWKLTAADAAAACGVHAALLVGEKHAISADRAGWGKALADFSVDLVCGDGPRAQGHASNVLGGPVSSLRFLVQELARYPASAPLSAGEIITTGTLTDALPAKSGQTWHTELRGIDMRGIRVRFK
jgi:2-oxo-3-hexenedioate decarboxylase